MQLAVATDSVWVVASMNVPRCGAGSVNLTNRIYTVGGFVVLTFDSSKERRDVEVYDPQTNTWTELPSMFRPRRSHAVAALNGKIYVVGGESGDSVLGDVAVYTPDGG